MKLRKIKNPIQIASGIGNNIVDATYKEKSYHGIAYNPAINKLNNFTNSCMYRHKRYNFSTFTGNFQKKKITMIQWPKADSTNFIKIRIKRNV